MFTTLTALPDHLDGGDVIVVGSGPAGLTLAMGARERGARVILLESGGSKAAEDELNRVDITGLPFPGAVAGRARGFGGTGEKWAGQCLPLDELDLQARSWVAGSGWPIDPDEMKRWLGVAEQILLVEDAGYGAEGAEGAPVPLPALDPAVLEWRLPHYSPRHRLGARLRTRCARDGDLCVVLDATVVRMIADNGRVVGVAARSRCGAERTIYGAQTVLACGGLENARLLLDAESLLGDVSDRVGRGLQDHPYWLVGEVRGAPPELGQVFQSMSVRDRRIRPKVTLAPEQQRERAVLNCVADIELVHGAESGVGALKRAYDAVRLRRGVRAVARELPTIAADPGAVVRELVSRRKGNGCPPDGETQLLLRVQTEQPPLGPSRVALSHRVDALGRRCLDLRWEVGEEEQRTCLGMSEVFGRQLENLGLGSLTLFPWLHDLREFRAHAVDFYHHAGTTRMSRTAEDGVVDVDCRVHGLDGLYVVGGSVFPASGYANPTLTIVALAARLAEHLSAVGVR